MKAMPYLKQENNKMSLMADETEQRYTTDK